VALFENIRNYTSIHDEAFSGFRSEQYRMSALSTKTMRIPNVLKTRLHKTSTLVVGRNLTCIPTPTCSMTDDERTCAYTVLYAYKK
jgi:hypothetical protein